MKLNVPTLASLKEQGQKPDVVFWVGCAGSFDDRAKKITKAFVKILNHTNTSFAWTILMYFLFFHISLYQLQISNQNLNSYILVTSYKYKLII